MSKWWPIGAGVITVILIALAAMLLMRKGLWRRCGAAGVTVLAAASALAAIGLTSNLQMGFFSNTSALFALADDDTQALKPVAQPATEVADDGRISADTDPSPDPQWHMQMVPSDDMTNVYRADWTGPNSKVSSVVAVWLPPGYSPTDGKTYSVIEFMHGFPGSWRGVVRALNWETTYSSLIADGTIKPTIFVVPDLISNEGEPDCRDFPGRPQVETWVTRDVPKAIRSTFPNVSSERQDWAIYGISSGAYCSANLALRHPQLYGAGISMSGFDQPLMGALSHADAATQHDNVISQMIATLNHPAALYLASTASDPDAMAMINNAKALKNNNLNLQTVVQDEGGHTWKTWTKQLPDALRWWRSDGVQNWVKTVENPAAHSSQAAAAATPQPPAASTAAPANVTANNPANATANTAAGEIDPATAANQLDAIIPPCPPFSLMGTGTIILASLIALALLLAVTILFPGYTLRPVRHRSVPGAPPPSRTRTARLASAHSSSVSVVSRSQRPHSNAASIPVDRLRTPLRRQRPQQHVPTVKPKAWRRRYAVALAAVLIVVIALVVAALLKFNADERFFTSLPELISGLPTMFP
ncbi:alpha/beta hydrolase [Trueperella sp. LYQ143]|uniref:alpha/beta hydrolase n=1 Tax=unclassified Trueperella TaxID=2630174 RepID=UPI003982FF7A